MFLLAIVQLLAVGLSLVGAAPVEDKVTYLPGLDIQATFNHYAGYLEASGGKNLFYWFIESETEPSTDPLVLWLNGGPGCSSLFGLLTENGPWRIKPGRKGLEKLEYRWNKIANMLYLDSPACVGFSYANDGNCTTGDNQTALNNHLALKSFFIKFPELKQLDVYLTGESYGGIYVPTLASRLEDDPDFNFKGFAVGNGLLNLNYFYNSGMYYNWYRGLIGPQRWQGLVEHCCEDLSAFKCSFSPARNADCEKMMELAYDETSSSVNPYNIYDECHVDPTAGSRRIVRETEETFLVSVIPEFVRNLKRYEKFASSMSEKEKMFGAGYPCVDKVDIEAYLTRDDVRLALHVSEKAAEWQACTRNVSRNYHLQHWSVQTEFLKVLRKGHRIVVYFGDFDYLCNYLHGMWFTESLNITVIEPYKPWFYDDTLGNKQVGGFAIHYQDLTFLTVKGAGHSVPADKPRQAYLIFEKFLKNEMHTEA